MALKICVYAISLNEEKFVKPFYESAKAADLIIIADTGSTDDTVKLAKKLGIKTFSIGIKPFRFDHARNAALALVPTDYDVCIALDMDEQLTPGWRKEIEELWDARVNHMQYRYDWGHGHVFDAIKIHARQGFFWRHACHEMIFADPRTEETWVITDKVMITHHQDPEKSRSSYLSMLETAVKENPHDSRDSFYLGREYYYVQDWDKSISEFDHYLSLPTSKWPSERSFALRMQSQCYYHLNNAHMAMTTARFAVDQARDIREPWLALSEMAYNYQLWPESLYAAIECCSITTREWTHMTNRECWTYKPYDQAAIAAYNLGMRDTAIKYGQQALDLDPNNPRLRDNMQWYAKMSYS